MNEKRKSLKKIYKKNPELQLKLLIDIINPLLKILFPTRASFHKKDRIDEHETCIAFRILHSS